MALLLISVQIARAASATWSATPSTNDWNTAANWMPATVPSGIDDTATFAKSTQTSLILSQSVPLDGITFGADASAYTISLTAQSMSFWGSGVINSSGTSQNFALNPNPLFSTSTVTFYNSASAGSFTTFDNRGTIRFLSNSTADGGTFLNRSAPAVGGTAPQINFEGATSAGTGTFVNFGGAASGTEGASMSFNYSSTAAAGNFTINGSAAAGAYGANIGFWGNSSADRARFLIHGSMFNNASTPAEGYLTFRNNASASNGLFTVNGGTGAGGAGGFIQFSGTATAANAILLVNGGSGGGPGGSLIFFEDASGGTAPLKLFGNSSLDISVHNAPGLTVGSIEGSGSIFLGARNLTVGSTNVNSGFSGIIQNGGIVGGVGGSLTKIGPSSLTVSGANTYTGGTIIDAGRLLAENSNGSGTGNGSVTVDGGGSALGGSGIIGGSVSVSPGAVLLGGDATTATGALRLGGNVSLNSGAVIALTLGAPGAHSTLTRTGGIWTFAPNQGFTFLDLGAQPGFYDNIITGLAGDPGGIASWTITNAGFAGTFVYDGAGNIDLNLTATAGPVLQLTSAVSRKLHGGLGPFDVPLPLTGEPGVECRDGNGNHTLVFTFSNNVVSGNASVGNGEANVTGNSFSGTTMTVNLMGVADVQKITVTLSNVRDSLSQILPDKAVKLNMLIGDTNGNRTVNASDIGQTKGQSGAPVTIDNFRTDINASGTVTASDIGQLKANSGHTLPPET